MTTTEEYQPSIHRFPWGVGNQVCVVHFGSKSTPLIAQLLREVGVKSCVVNADDFPAYWRARPTELRCVILSGGDRSVFEEKAPTIPPEVFQDMRTSQIPVLGICYGAQLLAQLCGGVVARAEKPEYDVHAQVRCVDVQRFGLYQGGRVVMNHRDEIAQLPEGWTVYGSTDRCRHAFVGGCNLFAVQFHPEMGHTEGGHEILRKLVFGLAGCTIDYAFSPVDYVQGVRDWASGLPFYPLAVAAFSGGVDSAVAREILRPVFAERLQAVFVDNGFMRLNEAHGVQQLFGNQGITYVDASDAFREAVQWIAFPSADTPTETCRAGGVYFSQIRKTIGSVFFRIFAEQARLFGATPGTPSALIQGTNCADVIESKTKIKGHHNLEEIASTHWMDIVEPLAGLYKSEIRQVGLFLGLPEVVAFRQPFPGPGLALRFSGRFFPEYIPALQQANAILEEEVAHAWPNLRHPERPCQYYVALAPLPTVGLMGDDRVVGMAWILRMVWSGGGRENYATLDVRPLPADFQERLAHRLISDVVDVGIPFTRVFYELTGKPPSTTELH